MRSNDKMPYPSFMTVTNSIKRDSLIDYVLIDSQRHVSFIF